MRERRSLGYPRNYMVKDSMKQNSFAIQSFSPRIARLLGEGIWGRVYDLGDGTVLKLARENCGGVGSGRKKIEKEYAALTMFADVQPIRDLLPRALEKGDVPLDSPLAKDGFALWLRMTKKEGAPLYVYMIEELSSSDKRILGENIGRTLARLHAAMATVPYLQLTDSSGPFDEIKKIIPARGFYQDAIAFLEQEYARIPTDIIKRPAHNDFNTSNLLFSGLEVCGILDFAECGANFPEKDIGDILKECPSLEEPMIAGYEAESGFTIDRRRLLLGLAENALYGVVISERLGDPGDAGECRSQLKQLLNRLDSSAPGGGRNYTP